MKLGSPSLIGLALMSSLSLAIAAAGCGPGDANGGGDDDDVINDGGRDSAINMTDDGGQLIDAGPLADVSLLDDRVLPPGDDAGCLTVTPGTPPFPRRCAPSTLNECDTATDTSLNVGMPLRNGLSGNGFDDDCDGQVDEGCGCPGNGATRDCYLTPATQADPATGLPVGWCTANSKGSLDCVGTEFAKWSGTCRGGQPPYPDDSCSLGDFNCDGLAQNSRALNCSCQMDAVRCPTAAITLAPYPPPGAIPGVDGSAWITDPANRANATNWTWTVVGGDCDNVLPNPTYAIYNQANSAAGGARVGAGANLRFNMASNRYEVGAGTDPLRGLRAMTGNGAAAGRINPAFALSGDYIVQGEFDLGGMHYTCSQRVEVRAPGVRAELCWDTVGSTDVDLHFAQLQGTSCPNHGWEGACAGQEKDDCWYAGESGCRDGSGSPPGWGYADSPNSACIGWGSRRAAPLIPGIIGLGCTNPRLDTDNISCSRTQTDPTNNGLTTGFCGPENINLDNPRNGERFLIGVNYYSGSAPTKPHVNIYCNGARVLSAGYNPVTNAQFPVLTRAGADTTGDIWNVATVRTNVTGGSVTSCDVMTVPSRASDPGRDGPAGAGGGNALCVDSTMNASTPPFSYTSHQFVDMGSTQMLTAGSVPASAPGFCKH